MKNAKFIFKLAAILFAIVFVCTLLLVLANDLTKGRIAELKLEAENTAKLEVLPDASSFDLAEAQGVAEAYIGKDADGNTVGYCFKSETSGFGGVITMMVGVKKDGTLSGVRVTNLSETPGLGAKATDFDWISQFDGKSDTISVVKTGNAKGNEINAISGATITSKAVTSGVNKALDAAKALMEKEGE